VVRVRPALLAVLVAVPGLAATSAAGAERLHDPATHHVTTVQFRFVPDLVFARARDSLIYTNADVVEHNIVSERIGPDGKPLFQTDLMAPGQSAPVTGVERLRPATYAFYCAPHPWMVGELRVLKWKE
jgi:plastocyanin